MSVIATFTMLVSTTSRSAPRATERAIIHLFFTACAAREPGRAMAWVILRGAAFDGLTATATLRCRTVSRGCAVARSRPPPVPGVARLARGGNRPSFQFISSGVSRCEWITKC